MQLLELPFLLFSYWEIMKPYHKMVVERPLFKYKEIFDHFFLFSILFLIFYLSFIS